ncbi:MAG TPA: threonine/serine dehydratase [Candidatus Baltobacteraceae bacterium]|jgi:threonine dehydratase|nr:threonine/serine dehydratase [Candidatus Baltobacteraceae bacterium]
MFKTPDKCESGALDRERITSMYPVIAPYVRRTPLLEIRGADVGLPHASLALKFESMQPSGSFKVRGAFANLLTRTLPKAGVAAASGGNHGAAVAYAAMRLGVPARIFVPEVSSSTKVDRIRAYGALLTITGQRYNDTLQACREYIDSSGALEVHAFDAYETMLGTGTVGLEVEQQFPQVDTVLVAVGGGGLIGGIAAWFADSAVDVVGVEPEGAPTLARAMQAGLPVDAPAGSIADDSLAPARIGDLVFPIVQRKVHRVVLVSDEEIRAAQQALWNGVNAVVEPGGAAAFAAVVSRRYEPAAGERVCVIVSGGNSTAVSF